MTDFTKVDEEFYKRFYSKEVNPSMVDHYRELLFFWHSQLEEAVGEERKFIGKQRREWYMRGVREERERIFKTLSKSGACFNGCDKCEFCGSPDYEKSMELLTTLTKGEDSLTNLNKE